MRRALVLLLLAPLGCATAPAEGPSPAPASTPASGPASTPASGPAAEGHGHGHADHGHGPEHGHGDPMQHRFEDPEYWSKRFDDPARDAWQKPKAVVELMALAPGMTVADIGAGTGYFLPHLADAVGAGGRVRALDVEPTLVEHMTQRMAGQAHVTAQVVPHDDPKLEAATVDRVLIVDTWHHIGGRTAYAAKILSGLKPGGHLFVVDFTMDSPMGPPPKHRIPPETVAKTLQAAGFVTEVMAEDLPNQYVVRGTRPE